MKTLSSLASSIPTSVTLAVNDKANALKAAGEDVIALAGGDPDFATPDHITAAAFAAIENGATTLLTPNKKNYNPVLPFHIQFIVAVRPAHARGFRNSFVIFFC